MRAEYLFGNGETRIQSAWQPGSEAVLEISRVSVRLDDLNAAYLRPLELWNSSSDTREAIRSLLAWADHSDGRIVNRPTPSVLNNSKPLQAQAIARSGLQIPETLITTDPQVARDFARLHGQVVYKSISGMRSIVRRLSPDRIAELDCVTHCPTQFQRYIPGNDVRVHVIGELVSALRIVSNRDDYRYAARDGGSVEAFPFELDPEVAIALQTATVEMGLLVAGIDLRRMPNGDLYCLEVNPSPAFTYNEQLAGVALAPAIARLLQA